MITAILFDLDGTLLNTSVGIIESVAHTIKKMELPELSEGSVLKFVGPPIQNSLIQFCGCSPQLAQKGAEIFRDYYKHNALFKANLYPGIYNLLLKLKNHGIKIGVATYKREDYAIKLLDHFSITNLCDVVHGADNENKLSKGDIVEICIKELGEDKSHILLIGDTEHDANGANEAGVGFIAVTWGFGFKTQQDVKNYPFRAVVNTPEDILQFIDQDHQPY